MKLELSKRKAEKRSEANRLRREGKIPAIIYDRGKNSEVIAIDNNQLQSMMRQVPPGRLSTTVFTLVDDKGKQRKVILKDIQYHVTSYNIIHVDLEELHDDRPVNVKVPIECTGVVDCVGVKLGGNLRQVLRYVQVRCLPKDIPTVIEVDVKNLGLDQSYRLADLPIPNTVRPLINLKEVAVAIERKKA